MDLRELQKTMGRLLEGRQAIEGATFLAHDPALPAAQRIAIYGDSMRATLVETLRLTYPHCLALVGERFFQALAWDYMQTHPSTSPNLNDYGACFAAFIDQWPAAQSLPYLGDMARLEWAHQQAYFGAEPSPCDWGQLEDHWRQGHYNLIFRRPGHSTLLFSRYPIYRIWQLNQGALDREVRLDEGPAYLFIDRPEQYVRILELNATSYTLIQQFDDGQTLEAILEHAATEEDAVTMAQMLPELIQQGVFADFISTQKINAQGGEHHDQRK